MSRNSRRFRRLAAVGVVLTSFGAPDAFPAGGAESPPAGPVEPAQDAAGTAAPSDLTALLEDYRSLHPGPRGIPVQGRTGRVGHLELAFADGTLFPLMTRQGAVLGFYFDGAGRYYYRTEDPADRLVIAANCSRETSAPIYYNYTVGDAFKRVVMFFAAPLFADLLRTPPGEGPPITAGQASDFDRIWKRTELTYLEFDHLAAEARLNGGDRQYVYAELEGGRETAGFTLDTVQAFTERLVLFRKVQGSDVRTTRQLSEQEIAGGTRTHPPSLVLKKVGLAVSTEDNRFATIDSDLTLRATTDGVRIARLQLLNGRDPHHYDWTSPTNRLEIRSVTDGEGRGLPYSHRYHQVLVLLPAPLARGDTQRLKFTTEGEILTDIHGTRDDNYFQLMFDPWYPQSSFWSGGSFESTLRARTRKPFRPVASGETRAFREDENSFEIETHSDSTSASMVLFAGKYVTREYREGRLGVHAHAYAAAREDVLEKIPKVARQFLAFYEQGLGPYPFGDLHIVEAPEFVREFDVRKDVIGIGLIRFGIAPPGLVLMTSDAYNPQRIATKLEEYRRLFRDDHTWDVSRGVTGRLAHEIAHQWFPHQAMPASPRDAWLSESFAEYLSGLAMGASAPDERQAETFPQMFSGWQFQARGCKSVGSLETATMLSGENAYRDYTCLLYNRGPLVLHMLRALAGNDRFFAILRRFLARGREGPVTTDDFRKAAEAVLQTDMSWFFDQWYRKGGIPEIKVDYRVEPAGNGAFVLAGKARQVEGPAFKKIHIPLVLELEGGRRDLRLVLQDTPVEEFRFELSQRPRKVSVDPGRNNLAEYH